MVENTQVILPENQSTALVNRIPEADIKGLIKRREDIVTVMKEIMVEGIHYGLIPGCGDKPSLFKAGAEIICSTFHVAPKYRETVIDMGNGHREYSYVCELYTLNGLFLGSGVGSCSTMESKYRYVNDAVNTGQEVPKSYWKDRDQSLIGGKGYTPKKVDGKWFIFHSEGKKERDDIADTYNTVKKMGKKRSHTDATLTAFAMSDKCTQDIEELEPEEKSKSGPDQAKNVTPEKPQKDKPKNISETELIDKFCDYAVHLMPETNQALEEIGLKKFEEKSHFINIILQFCKTIKVTQKTIDYLDTAQGKLAFVDKFKAWCKGIKDLETEAQKAKDVPVKQPETLLEEPGAEG